jgi:hypothetical protein
MNGVVDMDGMNLYAVIRELHREKQRLDRIIREFESLERGAVPALISPARQRGRKSMRAEERREVSRRMRKYWASRRKA